MYEAINKLNNNKSTGLDTITAEELKCLTGEQMVILSDMYNDMFEQRKDLDLGSGKLILLNKPNKKKGPIENMRPIVLLSSLRKILSIITLHRIRPQVEEYLSPTQSGFRKDRCTGDLVWAHRWLKARTEKYQEEFTILGIDMSSAFDTVCRGKLMQVLESFLELDHIKLIKVLLANTSLTFSSGSKTITISTTLGTPQGDSLSPVLFAIYLEAALRDLRTKLPPTSTLTRELIYADDVDFLFDTKQEAIQFIPVISNELNKWNLKVNESKTEITHVRKDKKEWLSVRKLGNLINENEDIKKRKILAQNAFIKLSNIWYRGNLVSEYRKIQLYEALVLPILLYNCGTWGLTKKNLDCLDAFHRRQLRKVIGVVWPEKISSQDLYERCRVKPISFRIKTQRWQLFGHVLRRDENIPANLAMKDYFREGQKYSGRPPTSLQTTINNDLKTYHQRMQNSTNEDMPQEQLNTSLPINISKLQDIEHLRSLAEDRNKWRKIVRWIQESETESV